MGRAATERKSRPARRMAAAGLVVVLLLAAVAGAIWIVNRGPLPARWRAAIERELSARLGVPVTVEDVRLLGPSRLALTGIRSGGAVQVSVAQAVLGFSWRDLGKVMGTSSLPVRWVMIDGLEFSVPESWVLATGLAASQRESGKEDGGQKAAGGDTVDRAWAWETVLSRIAQEAEGVSVSLAGARIWITGKGEPEVVEVAGRATVSDGQLVLHGMNAKVLGGLVTVRGALLPNPELYAAVDVPDAAVLSDRLAGRGGIVSVAETAGVHTSGPVQAEVWVEGTWQQPRAWGTVQLSGTRWSAAGVSERPYAIDDGLLRWSYRPGAGVEVSLQASREATKLEVEGAIGPGGRLNLAVRAVELELPEDVAALARLGVDGRADFLGQLVGTAQEPVLAGELISGGGRLFGQPYTSLSATVRLSRQEFAFERARIAQGLSEYHLEGRIALATAGDRPPGDLHVVVRTDRGRAEALLAAIGWQIPAQADLSGTLVFDGAPGSVTGHGDVVLTQGLAFGQPFDRVEGRFTYGPGWFEVAEATGRVRGGDVQARGGGDPQGPWELEVSARDVPLQAVRWVRDRLPMVSGLVGFEGTVSRPGAGFSPAAAGTVAARHLIIGTMDFTEASGELRIEPDRWQTGELTLRRPGGGTYVAQGEVRRVLSVPELDLSVAVSGESLTDVLALTGLRVPILAPSGRVAAGVQITGTFANPDARIRMDAREVHVIGRRTTGVSLEMRLKDGRIEIEELARG
ncbi:MAG: hypothetical protein H0Z37_07730 [Firmicutes bacterium]|nr:hypothetical protein [Bacillota bacterium]